LYSICIYDVSKIIVVMVLLTIIWWNNFKMVITAIFEVIYYFKFWDWSMDYFNCCLWACFFLSIWHCVTWSMTPKTPFSSCPICKFVWKIYIEILDFIQSCYLDQCFHVFVFSVVISLTNTCKLALFLFYNIIFLNNYLLFIVFLFHVDNFFLNVCNLCKFS